MTIRVGINGFGRIGRYVVRKGIARDDIEFVGINDLMDPKTLAYLMKYDSVHGKFEGEVYAEANGIVVNGKHIPISAHRDPAEIPWGKLDTDVVMECTGIFRNRAGAQKHLDAGAKFVLISAPAVDEDITVVYGVNHEDIDVEKHKIISNASCTTNCLAPMAKVINDAFGIESGVMTTIHSFTNDQAVLDQPHKDPRRGRASAVSMIPTTTGAAKAVGKVLPELNGKMDGLAVRVPTPNVSLTDLSVVIKKSATVEEINAAIKTAAEGPLKGVLDFSDEALVSVDLMGNPHSSIFIADQTRSTGNLIKVLSWYDNEAGFSYRMLDVAAYIGSKIK